MDVTGLPINRSYEDINFINTGRSALKEHLLHDEYICVLTYNQTKAAELIKLAYECGYKWRETDRTVNFVPFSDIMMNYYHFDKKKRIWDLSDPCDSDTVYIFKSE